MYTLRLKDEDLEYEWRLNEIRVRKGMAVATSILCLIQDVGWTLLLSEVNSTGKIIKAVIDVLVFIGLYQTFFRSKIKEVNEIV